MDVNILIFDDFETLDVFGPVEVLGRVEEYNLHYISDTGGIMTSRQGTKIVTTPLKEANPHGILLIPGGKETRALVHERDFVRSLRSIAESSTYCLSVCTGSALLSKTGLLNGKRATSNKKAFDWVQSIEGIVEWVKQARWVVDGKYYTSSGVSAGIDMALGFVADQFSVSKAESLADDIEYIWNADSTNDPFAKETRRKI